MTLQCEALFEQYDVDVPHTHHVASLSLTLFDLLQKPLGLPQKARDVLHAGALLHDIGVSLDEKQHNTVGRDIVLRGDFEDMDDSERALVACLVSFHRKKVRPELEPAYVRLGKKDRQLALSLAALLRVADGLDYSHTQTTHIVGCDVADKNADKNKGRTIVLHVAGADARDNGNRAIKKADLWCKTFPYQLEVRPVSGKDKGYNKGQADVSPAPSLPSASSTSSTNGTGDATLTVRSLLPEYTVAERGRWLLRTYFHKMVSQEKGVKADKDIEFVHDMRVATRRIRALLPVIDVVAPKKDVRRLRKGIRDTARALGEVRDCDVFLDQIHRYLNGLPEGERPDLSPLIQSLQRDRAEARTHLLTALDSQRYERFKRDFALFVTGSTESWNTALRVCDMAGSRIWRCYEELRAYETRVNFDDGHSNDSEVLHDMRIAGKHLRYLLDIFGTLESRHVKPVLEPLVALQNCLGVLQDISVAQEYLATLDVSKSEQKHLNTYRASREAERTHQLAELPRLWEKVVSATYRRKLMELIIKL